MIIILYSSKMSRVGALKIIENVPLETAYDV